jgi:hypothetical protein
MISKVDTPLKYKTWQCGTCGSVLGMVYPTGLLAIKHKEFYCWIEGRCKVICRRCSVMNFYTTASGPATFEDFDRLQSDDPGR